MWIANVSAQKLVDLFQRGATTEPVMMIFIPGDTASADMLAGLQQRAVHLNKVLRDLVAYVFVSDLGEGVTQIQSGTIITPEHVDASLRPALAYAEYFEFKEQDLPAVVFLIRGIWASFSLPLENMSEDGLERASRGVAQYFDRAAILQRMGRRLGKPKQIVREYEELLRKEKKLSQRFHELAFSIAGKLKLTPEQRSELFGMLWSPNVFQRSDIEKVVFRAADIKRESRVDALLATLSAHAQIKNAMAAAPTATEIDSYLDNSKSTIAEVHAWLEQCFRANLRRASIGTPPSAWDRAKEMTGLVADLVTIGSAAAR